MTFVYLGAEQLGIEYISSFLKSHGHETALAFDPALFDDRQYLNVPVLRDLFSYRKKLIREIIGSKPDLVAFSVISDAYQWACGIAEGLRRLTNVPIIFGGIHPTAVPEEVISKPFVDIVCIGEGEHAMLELLDSMAKGKIDCTIRNLWFKKGKKIIRNPLRPLMQNLDELPFPDKRLFEKNISMRHSYAVMTSRGCPYSCTYCSNNLLKRLYSGTGCYIRKRSVGNVMDELRSAKKMYNFKEVMFHDDVLTFDKPRLKELMRRYKGEIGIPFNCQGHPLMFDEEIAAWLKDAGCYRVVFGVQCMNDRIRKEILHRPDKNADVLRALRICDDAGLDYCIDHIFGFPTEAEEDAVFAARAYNNTKRCAQVKAYSLSLFPGTELVDICKSSGCISEKDVKSITSGGEKMYFHGGSVRDPKLRMINRNFEVLFKFMPLLPKEFVNFILDKKIYRYLHIVPGVVVAFVEILVAILKGDLRLVQYLAYYWRNTMNLLGLGGFEVHPADTH